MNGILIHHDEMEVDGGSHGLEDKAQEVHLVLEDDLDIVRENDVLTMDDLFL